MMTVQMGPFRCYDYLNVSPQRTHLITAKMWYNVYYFSTIENYFKCELVLNGIFHSKKSAC